MRRQAGACAGLIGAQLLLGCAGPAPVTLAAPAPAAVPQSQSAAAPEAALAVQPAAPPVAWPKAAGCREIAAEIGRLPPAAAARLDPATAPLALAVRDGPTPLPPAETVSLDLPLPVDDGSARCVLVVAPAPTVRAAPRRPLAHEIVRSTYRVAGGGRPNPDYRRLQQELRRVDRSEDIDFLATGDPGIDLIGLIAGGVLQGIDAALMGRAEAGLRAELAATPPTVAEPRWEPYSFEVTTIEATRSGRLRVQLVDRASDRAWSLDEPVVERRRFRVAAGRRARDRGLLEGGGDGLVAMTTVAVWEQEGLRPNLTWLVAALGARTGPGRQVAEIEATAPAAGPAGSGDPSDVPSPVGAVESAIGADGVRRFRLREPGPDAPVSPAS
jgi:hypothetical protein